MSKLVDLPPDLWKRKLAVGFFDDFLEYVSADLWTLVTTNDGTAAIGTTVNGELTLESAVNDAGDGGDEAALIYNTHKPFLFAANKPIRFGARVKLGSSTTEGDHQFFVGVTGVVTEELIADASAGMIATANECVGFFGYEGSSTAYQMFTIHQNDTTQNTITLDAATSLDGTAYLQTTTYKVLEFDWIPRDSAYADALFYIDGVLVARESNVGYATTPATMAACLAVKSGAGTTTETMVTDYCYCYQTRT